MISVEQARKNVEHHNAEVAKLKVTKAKAFIEKVVEPAIIEASMHGKNETAVTIGECLDALTEVMGMIHEAGFQTERGRSDDALRITWYANGTPTCHNTVKAVVVLP